MAEICEPNRSYAGAYLQHTDQYTQRRAIMSEQDSRVHRGGGSVICKTEPMPVIASPLVKDTLVATVPRTLGLEYLEDFFELVLSRGEDHDSRVEDIRPTYVRHSGEFVRDREEVRHRPDRKDIGVEED